MVFIIFVLMPVLFGCCVLYRLYRIYDWYGLITPSPNMKKEDIKKLTDVFEKLEGERNSFMVYFPEEEDDRPPEFSKWLEYEFEDN